MMRAANRSTIMPDVPTPSDALLRSRAAVVFVTALAVGLALMAGLAPTWLLEVDRPVSEWIRDRGAHGVFTLATQFGSIGVPLVFGVAAATVLWRRCRPFAYTVPVVLAFGVAIDLLIKMVVDRPRPLDPVVGTGFGSFPSGHVVITVMVLGLLVPTVLIVTERRIWFRAAVGLLLVAVPVVAVSRINLGAHWPSDVVASVFIGAAILLAAEYIAGSVLVHRDGTECALHPAGADGDSGLVRSDPDRSSGEKAPRPRGQIGMTQPEVEEE
ncbi:MAG: phosphatase PAP2 family protein [Acidobacteria bacterium]|nr:phosphatase PAP2 family protein [Acidobacteriota bacterium]